MLDLRGFGTALLDQDAPDIIGLWNNPERSSLCKNAVGTIAQVGMKEEHAQAGSNGRKLVAGHSPSMCGDPAASAVKATWIFLTLRMCVLGSLMTTHRKMESALASLAMHTGCGP